MSFRINLQIFTVLLLITVLSLVYQNLNKHTSFVRWLANTVSAAGHDSTSNELFDYGMEMQMEISIDVSQYKKAVRTAREFKNNQKLVLDKKTVNRAFVFVGTTGAGRSFLTCISTIL